MAYTFQSSFAYFEGPNWATYWRITVMKLDDDGRSDLFFYNPATGAWMAGLMWPNGQFVFPSHLAGTWARDWTLLPLDTAKDGRDELVLYNTTPGQWFQVAFSLGDDVYHWPYISRYTTGFWSPGATLTRMY